MNKEDVKALKDPELSGGGIDLLRKLNSVVYPLSSRIKRGLWPAGEWR